MTFTNTVVIDDNDPSIQYNGAWIVDTSSEFAVHRTRHGSTQGGMTASYTFTGTGIRVVGIIGPSSGPDGQPQSTYQLDGGHPTEVIVPFTMDTTFNVTFFEHHGLHDRQHNLLIVHESSPHGDSVYWLDYLVVDVGQSFDPRTTIPDTPTTVPTDRTIQPPSESSTTTSSGGTSIASVQPTSQPSHDASQSTENTQPTNTRTTTEASSNITTSSSRSRSSESATPSSISVVSSMTMIQQEGTSTTTMTPTAIATGVSHRGGVRHINIVAVVAGVLGVVVLIGTTLLFVILRRRLAQAKGIIQVEPFVTDPRRMPLDGTSPSNTRKCDDIQSQTPPPSPSYASEDPGLSGAFATAPSTVPQQDATQESLKKAEEIPASRPQTGTLGVSSAPARAQPSSVLSSDLPPPSVSGLHVTEITRHPWYAPPGLQARAHSLLNAVSGRARGRNPKERRTISEMDSGLRMYPDTALPPPYTAD